MQPRKYRVLCGRRFVGLVYLLPKPGQPQARDGLFVKVKETGAPTVDMFEVTLDAHEPLQVASDVPDNEAVSITLAKAGFDPRQCQWCEDEIAISESPPQQA